MLCIEPAANEYKDDGDGGTQSEVNPGWDCPSTAYIDNQDLLDRSDTVSTPFERDDKPVLDFDGDVLKHELATSS